MNKPNFPKPIGRWFTPSECGQIYDLLIALAVQKAPNSLVNVTSKGTTIKPTADGNSDGGNSGSTRTVVWG